MVIMNARLAETFMKKNPGTQIQVTGDGSGVGIANLINGTTEIAALSRPIRNFYLRTNPEGDTQKFVDWILTPEGQDIVAKVGYFPVK